MRMNPYRLDLSKCALPAIDALSTACREAKAVLSARSDDIIAKSAHTNDPYAVELRAAAAHFFYFQDRGPDGITRTARRLCAAIRLYCEFVDNSRYLKVYFRRAKVGLLRALTAWAAHAPDNSRARHVNVVNASYLANVATALQSAVSFFVAAAPCAPLRRFGGRLMWHYPKPQELTNLLAITCALNDGCRVVRRAMDVGWRRGMGSRSPISASAWEARMHVFSLNGHAPSERDNIAELLDKLRRLCLGLRIAAEAVGRFFRNVDGTRAPESEALYFATEWASHPENRRLREGERITDTIVLCMPLIRSIVDKATAMVTAVATMLPN